MSFVKTVSNLSFCSSAIRALAMSVRIVFDRLCSLDID